MRACFAVAVSLLLSGCTTYLLQVEPDNDPQTSNNITASGAAPKVVQQDIYTSVYATATGSGQNQVDACHSYWAAQIVMNRKENIAVSASLQLGGAADPTNIPIYAVSHDGRNCQLSFNPAYLLTPQLRPIGSHDAILGKYNYDVTSTENISKYLNDGLALASVLAPQAAPVVATATQILSSSLAQDVRTDVNAANSQSVDVTMPLVDLWALNQSYPSAKTIILNYDVTAAAINNNTISSKTTLANLKLFVERRSTFLGNDVPNALPDYVSVGSTNVRNTRITIVDTSGAGTSARIANVYDLVNAAVPGVPTATNIEQLPTSPAAGVVSNYCQAVRSTLVGLGFNEFDQAAYLWALYSRSGYHAGGHDDFINNKSDCLSSTEIENIKKLGISTW